MIITKKTKLALCVAAAAALPLVSSSAHETHPKAQTIATKDAVKAAKFDPVVKNMEGWTVHIDPKLLKGEHAKQGGKALQMLANHLQRINILVVGKQLKDMHKVGIWIEHSHPELSNMQYHPGGKWLAERGYDARLVKKVHITQATNLLKRDQLLKHPAVILHELAHGYHDQILGFEEPRVMEAYNKAMKAKLYDEVLLFNGRKVRAYAATNHKEYFAEGVESYFYRNDFYPFVRAELKIHDPFLHDVMEQIWGPLM
ncbi:MAG: metallopeptidase [Akkermansiaceae bacterium]